MAPGRPEAPVENRLISAALRFCEGSCGGRFGRAFLPLPAPAFFQKKL
jgi:hypothetical protein